ncbi:hypothetical protein SLS59_002692 [Nothophoma quercina]|uniref:AB hydrolase-1 domain-containing protein n=1 Tax=Nothophoma quercina TaxID=749835 RepID=A0ABR3RRD5_9PLEO
MLLRTLYYTLGAIGTGVAAYLLRRPKPTNFAPLNLHGAESCKYILDDSHSHTFTLPDGRKLGYADYGDPKGKTILYQHGLPGSRTEATRYHELGKELGIRVVSIDRPVFGWSTPFDTYRGRTVRSWAADVECLAEHLELSEYAVLVRRCGSPRLCTAVLVRCKSSRNSRIENPCQSDKGVSGGGPYALSCAHGLPKDKLKVVGLVCGIGSPDIGMSGAAWPRYSGFTVGWRWSPQVFLRWFFQRDAADSLNLPDEERLKLFLSEKRLEGMDERDRTFFADEDEMRAYLATSRQSFRQGVDAMCKDGFVMCTDWGFRIEDIRKDVSVVLWYGSRDVNVPPNHGRTIARRLRMEEEQVEGEVREAGPLEYKERVRLRMLDDTHASISMRDKRGYLVDISNTWRK